MRAYFDKRPNLLAYLMTSLGFVIALSIAVAGYTTAQKNSEEVASFATDLRDGLVANCEQNGNPLRDAVKTLLRGDIQQTKQFLASGQYYDFFPNIPPKQLRRLINNQIERSHGIIHSIPNVDCEALYPPEDFG